MADTNLLESIDGSLHEIRQVPERRKNLFAFEDFNISKSYVEGRLHILVFFHIAGKSEEYLALFRNKQGADPWDKNGFFLGGWVGSENIRDSERRESIRVTDGIVYSADTLGLRDQKFVFIGNVHFVKPPESIIPAEVRLQSVDSIFVGNANSLYLSWSGRCVLAGTIGNREIRTLARGSACIFDKGDGEMVKSGPEIMDGIPDNQANDRIDFGDILDHVIGVCRLRIVLRPERAWVCFEKDVELRLHIADVVIGPVDL
jgi:hypothetical protein